MLSNLRLSIRSQLYASSIVTCLMLVVLVGIAALQLRRLSRETTASRGASVAGRCTCLIYTPGRSRDTDLR